MTTENEKLKLLPLVETSIDDKRAEEIKQRISFVSQKADYYLGIDAYAMTEVKELANDAKELLAELQRLVAELEEERHDAVIASFNGGHMHAIE